MTSIYPDSPSERDRWITALRPGRNRLDPWRPYASLVEAERGPDGRRVETLTVLLTNRECPFRCVMCDLWRNTLTETVPPGAIAGQIRHALEATAAGGAGRHLKLYNAGSFFDPRAIPPAEYEEIAALAAPFDRVIVECHPAFLGERCLRFRDLLAAHGTELEVAVGLETIHPEVLPRLNKRMTLEQFRSAAEWLGAHGMALRVFLMVRPPWLTEEEGVEWACRSLEYAFNCAASACTLIPARDGNGAMQRLAEAGEWAPPRIESVERALEYGLTLGRGRVFADLWDIERFARCAGCAPARIGRLRAMNDAQVVPPAAACPAGCGEGA